MEEVDHYELTSTEEEYPLKGHELAGRKYQRMTFIEEEIMLSFLYPRMDYNVSTSQNHLLKLPFSIHPSSKKVSVPMFSQDIDMFNPKECVDIEGLMKELHQLEGENALVRGGNVENAHKTLLTQNLRAM